MVGDDPLKGFVAYCQFSASLPSGYAQFQEGTDPFGVLRVSGLDLFLPVPIACTAPGWFLEGNLVQLGVLVDVPPADAEGCGRF